jgi:hypothetical protein
MLAATVLKVFSALSRASPHPALRADLPRKGGGEDQTARPRETVKQRERSKRVKQPERTKLLKHVKQ